MLAILGPIISLVAGRVFDSFDLGQRLKLTREQFVEETRQHVAASSAEIEKAWAEATAKIIAETQATVRASFTSSSWVTRNAWAFVVLSQTLVLLWYQVGIPFYVHLFGGTFPRTGDGLLQWAYALVAGALGIGALQSGRETVKDLIGLARA